MINDTYGGYYRVDRNGARWRWFAGVDVGRSASGTGIDSAYYDAGVRRQFDGVGVGGQVALRVVGAGRRVATGPDGGTVGAKQLLAYVELPSRFGLTRLEGGYGFDRRETLAQASATQTWTLPSWLPAGSRLSTQLFWNDQRQRDVAGSGTAVRGDGFGVAVDAGGDLFARVSVDASLAYGGTSGGSAGIVAADAGGGAFGDLAGFGSGYAEHGRTFSASLAANARLSPHWTINASLTDSETSLRQAFGLASALPTPFAAAADRFRLVSATVALRYVIAAGRPTVPVGRASFAGGGTGGIAGHLFLDGNGNGRRDAGEAGVRDVVVTLDGRVRTRTDAAGYFRFDEVAEGAHTIAVDADALPLPWHYARAGRPSPARDGTGFSTDVAVAVRHTALCDIAAVR